MSNGSRLRLIAGFVVDQGLRPTNEDAAVCDPANGVFIVADGLGGHTAGEVASALATETICSMLSQERPPPIALGDLLSLDELLRIETTRRSNRSTLSQYLTAQQGNLPSHLMLAFLHAHLRIIDEARQNPELGNMSTAAVAAWVQEDTAHIAHVGDCRLYVFCGNGLELMTRDHSLVASLVEEGHIDESAAALHPFRNRLTQVLGGRSTPVPYLSSRKLRKGDRLLLCSDGVWGSLSETQVYNLLKVDRTPLDTAKLAVRTALEAGSTDNSTALVVMVEEETE
jgi:serine/threonine protein phosphatase PrpC